MTGTTSRNAAIQGLKDYRKELAGHISQLQEDLRVVDQSIVLISGHPSTPESSGIPNQTADQDMGPQEAVENFLRNSPGTFYRPRDLGKELQKNGYQVRAKKPEIWFAQVTNSLRRAVSKGIAEMRQVDGKKTYGLKRPEGSGETHGNNM
jgi:hypothetical protein